MDNRELTKEEARIMQLFSNKSRAGQDEILAELERRFNNETL